MEVTMDDVAGDVEFSGCSSTTTSSPSLDNGAMGMYAWKALSPVMPERGLLYPDPDDGAEDLIESMLCDGALFISAHVNNPAAMLPNDMSCYSNGSDCDDDRGLRLLHLLMAAAEALSGQEKSRELARVILARLKQMVSHTSGDNAATADVSNMERLATHFADALQVLVDVDGSLHAVGGGGAPGDVRLTAFKILQDMSPYVKFGYFTANQAILEAVAASDDCRRVHVVDYDITEGVQWASLMQAMTTSRRDGVPPPPPHLHITAVSRRGGSRPAVQEPGRRLAAFAASVGQPFSFAQCRLDSDQWFHPATVRTVKAESLVANCVLSQVAATATTTVSRPTAGSVASFLAGMATLGAKVVTVVEEEDQRGDDDEAAVGGFLARFMEVLHRYSAMWDSLEAGFPTQSRVRGLVERAILAPNIVGAVSQAYHAAEDGDGDGEARAGTWGEWMRGNGFRAVPSRFNHSQARLLLALFNDGYTIEETSCNKIVLGWKARRLLSASVWTPPPTVSVPSSPTDGAVMLPDSGDFDYIDSFLVEQAYALV